MAEIKMQTGATMVVTEVAWRRKISEIAKLKSIVKEDNKLITSLRKELREAYERIDSQNERLIDMQVHLEKLGETAEKAREFLEEIA